MTLIATSSRPWPRPNFIIPIAAALCLTVGIGPNFDLAFLACIVLVIGVYLLWRPGEAQILLFIFAFQWLQLVTNIFYANLLGIKLSELMYLYPAVEQAAVLVAISLAFLAFGIRIGAGAQDATSLQQARSLFQRIPPARWLELHLIMWAISTIALMLAIWAPGLSQPLLALANMKWGTFVVWTIATFSRADGSRAIWIAIVAIEFVFSFGGYFSSFKFIFIYILIAISAVGIRLTISKVLSGATVCAVLLTLGLYWTAIKGDYRSFISGGERNQIVVVDYTEAVQKLIELVSQVDTDQLVKAAEGLASRFAEMDMFSAVLVYVPQMVPHEEGKIWIDAITRPFMPRVLFPDKAILDDSEMSRQYTGMVLAGYSEGTQISMGYIADSYIDFGEIGMMGVMLSVWVFYGFHLSLVHHPSKWAWGAGVWPRDLDAHPASSIGFSSAKMVGGITVCVLVALVLYKFVLPSYMRRLLR